MGKRLTKKIILGLVKRAYASAAKEEDIRSRFAYKTISLNWNIKDLDFWFTVFINNGEISVKEGETKDPDLVFYNTKAEDFHKGNLEEITGRDMLDAGGFKWVGHAKHLRSVSLLCKTMRTYYKEIAAGM